MARMHSRKRGQAGSVKPASKSAPSWVEMTETDLVQIIVDLAKQGIKAADIGRILRDKHGVPSTRGITGKKLTAILESNNLVKYPEDMLALIKKAVILRKHLKNNRQDMINKTALIRTESKINRLVRHYRGDKLPADWKYDYETAALLVK